MLCDLHLAVANGALLAVLGPSGCGKTTLLRIIAGFEHPTAGTVVVGGREVANARMSVPPERRRIGIVPQEGALFPHLSVADNVGFGLRHPRTSSRTVRAQRVENLLELVGLVGLGGRMPHELSGGQQQRVALARALAPEPAVVLLDEPFNGLDRALRAAVRDEVVAALRSAGATAVLVTHDQEEALSVADSVAVVSGGQIVQVGSPVTVYREPVSLAVATFVGHAIVVPAVATAATAECALGRVRLRDWAPAGPGHVVVRPEQVTLGPQGEVPATVLGTTYYGHDELVRLAVDGRQARTEVTARRAAAGEQLPGGTEVFVSVDGEVSFFPAP